MIQILPVKVAADIKRGDSLANMVIAAIKESAISLEDDDIIVIAQKIVSKAEGRSADLRRVRPSQRASRLAKIHGKDPRLVELILRNSTKVIMARQGTIISETHHGFICANAGVDQSNVESESQVVFLPLDSDRSARKLKNSIHKAFGKDVAVVITDTFGRPFRNGQTNVAIGIAGMNPLRSYIGLTDMYGRKLRVSEIAVADEIASAAELVMGKTNRVPIAIVRGYTFERLRDARIQTLLRDKKKDFFR